MSIPKADKKELLASLKLSEAQINIVRSPEKLKVRQGAAKGILPGTPEQTLSLMAAIAMAAPEEELRKTAVESAKSLPESTVVSYAESGSLPAVLWFLYRSLNENQAIKRKLYVNRSVPISLLVEAARIENSSQLLELLAGNQAKMAENPEFPGHLLENPALSPVARSRVEEFFMRTYSSSLLKAHGFESDDEDVAASETVELGAEATDTSELPEEFTIHNPEEEERLAKEELARKKYVSTEDEDDAEEEVPAERKSLYSQLANLTSAQKIKLALLGNMEARKLMIKESNRLIQESVVKNPRITNPEIQAIASNKQTSQEILRMISSNRTWMRKYALKLAMVQNPKTPQQVSFSLMNQLRTNELKTLAKSKAVSGQVAKQAVLMLKRRG